jgi:hypothetical protein
LAEYGVRLCTELTPVFLDVVVMAVFLKLDRYSAPGQTRCFIWCVGLVGGLVA